MMKNYSNLNDVFMNRVKRSLGERKRMLARYGRFFAPAVRRLAPGRRISVSLTGESVGRSGRGRFRISQTAVKTPA